MTHFDQLTQQIQTLYALVRLQKSLRLAVRAVWVGMAGTVLGWGVNAFTGWLPNPLTWVTLGFGLALVPVIAILVALYPVVLDLPPPRAWIYAIDRRLHMREQLSTAWEVAGDQEVARREVADREVGSQAVAADREVAGLLVADILALLPRARGQVLQGGWYRTLDLAAVGLLALLICAMLGSLLAQPYPQPAEAAPLLPVPQTGPQSPGSQPPSSEQQPGSTGSQPGNSGSLPGADQNGQPGQEQGGNNSAGDAGEPGSAAGAAPKNQPGDAPGRGMDSSAVAGALKRLGQQLSQQAGTYDLGQALQNLDMNGAADAMQDLSNQLKDLTPESSQNLSRALGQAARDLNQANAPSLSQDMQNAADALKSSGAPPAQALGQVAEDLRQLDSAMQAEKSGDGGGAGQGQNADNGQAPPFDRLPDENGQMEIPQENADNSGLLSPARPDAPADGTASGSLDAIRPQGSSFGQTPLLPNSFLWKWRDVVSRYFQH